MRNTTVASRVPIQAAPPIKHVYHTILPPPSTFFTSQQQKPSLPKHDKHDNYNNSSESTGSIHSSYPSYSYNGLASTQIAGVWKASIGGMICKIATPQTKLGKGYRAKPLHCPIAFSSINSWAVENAHLVFYDVKGNLVALLTLNKQAHFEGTTITGVPVVLSR